MLKLYHGKGSVCSIKVRIGLAEKCLNWKSYLIDLQKGEQFAPEYLKLNSNAVVPTLVDGDFVVIESSVILQYIDNLSDENILMPGDVKARTITQIWFDFYKLIPGGSHQGNQGHGVFFCQRAGRHDVGRGNHERCEVGEWPLHQGSAMLFCGTVGATRHKILPLWTLVLDAHHAAKFGVALGTRLK